MEKNISTQSEDRLLSAREELLSRNESTSLRPLGKLWGMDVFTWSMPQPGLIANTIHAFPFEVVWMGNKADVMATLNEDKTLCSNLQTVIVYDSPEFSMKDEWVCNVRNHACTSTVKEAMEMLKAVKEPRKILLFTSSGDQLVENREEFDAYVKMVQVK